MYEAHGFLELVTIFRPLNIRMFRGSYRIIENRISIGYLRIFCEYGYPKHRLCGHLDICFSSRISIEHSMNIRVLSGLLKTCHDQVNKDQIADFILFDQKKQLVKTTQLCLFVDFPPKCKYLGVGTHFVFNLMLSIF